jgi:hypothetical protein
MDDDEVDWIFVFDKKFIHGGVPLAAVTLHGHRNLWRSGPRSADANDNRPQELPEGTAPPDMVSPARAAPAGSVLVAVVLINFV